MKGLASPTSHRIVLLNYSLLYALLLAVFFTFKLAMTHDAVGWHGAYHYFYSFVEKGVLPLWNPYSQGGTPFYIMLQPLGLLEPSHFIFALIGRLFHLSTFTTYVNHYFFLFIIMIFGCYLSVFQLTKNLVLSYRISLGFGLCILPTILLQNGALNPYFLVPLLFYFLLRATNPAVKSRHLDFVFMCFLTGISMNIHVPTGIIFVFIFWIVVSVLTKTPLLGKISRGSLFFGLAIFGLLIAPAVVIYINLVYGKELFPSVRLLQHNGNKLLVCLVESLKESLFSHKFTQNIIHSLTLGNLLGIFLEPLNRLIPYGQSSEVFIHTGVVLILFIIFPRQNTPERQKLLVVAAGTILAATRLGFHIHATPSLNQSIMFFLFPFLKLTDAVQNLGILFVFFMIIVASISIHQWLQSSLIPSKLLWVIWFALTKTGAITLLTVMEPYFLYCRQFEGTSKRLMHAIFYVTVIGFLFVSTKMASRMKRLTLCHKQLIWNLMWVAMIAELGVAVMSYSYHFKAVDQKYYHFLEQNSFLKSRPNSLSWSHRSMFPSEDPPRFHTLMAYELLEFKPTLFPTVMRKYILGETSKISTWDHFFMLNRYYEFLTQISFEFQVQFGGVSQPIVYFFPSSQVKWFSEKYQLYQALNQRRATNSKKLLYLEVGDQTLSQNNHKLEQCSMELTPFQRTSHEDTSLSLDSYPFSQNVIRSTPNRIRIDFQAPSDGYLYLSEGYSRHWRATLNNQRVQILRANVNFQAIQVNKGAHTLEMVYYPQFYLLALVAYGVGLLLTCGYLVVNRKLIRWHRSQS